LSRFKPSAFKDIADPEKPVRAPVTPQLSTAVVTADQVEEPQPGVIQRIGFNALLVYLFFRFSFLHEFISGKIHFDLHIILALSLVCYLCALASGRLFLAFRNKISWFWLAFTTCMAIATATSFWRGGSFALFITYVRTALPIVVIIPALASTKKDIGKIISTIGIACALTVILGLANNDFRTGRMSIDQANSEIQDSNDFAAHLILMLPALAYLTLRPGKSVVHKILGAGLIAVALFEILSTGSRGGLVSLAITTLYMAFTVGPRLRVAILVGVPLLALAAIPFIPDESAARLQTLINANNSKAGEAVASSQARMTLLKESLRFTAEHPLFGIGPGEFMDVQAQNAQSTGTPALWHVTHNTYTQVSSECGIPALLFCLSAIGSTFLVFRRGRKARDRDLALNCSVLRFMMIGFAICVFFLSQAYGIQFLVLGGLAIVIQSLLPDEQASATVV
jgi:O-antigen ligase